MDDSAQNNTIPGVGGNSQSVDSASDDLQKQADEVIAQMNEFGASMNLSTDTPSEKPQRYGQDINVPNMEEDSMDANPFTESDNSYDPTKPLPNDPPVLPDLSDDSVPSDLLPAQAHEPSGDLALDMVSEKEERMRDKIEREKTSPMYDVLGDEIDNNDKSTPSMPESMPTTNSPQSSDQIQSEVFNSPQPSMGGGGSHKKLYVIIAILATLLIVSLGVVFYMMMSGQSTEEPVDDTMIEEPTATPTPIAMDIVKGGVIYIRDGELWEYKDGVKQSLTTTDQGIYTYDVAPDGTVAYVTGEVEVTENDFVLVKPDSVYLYIPESEDELIYKLDYTDYDSQEYSIRVRDVGFSDDSAELAITTSDGIYIYDLALKETTELYHEVVEDTGSPAIIYGYINPVFSPDNNTILIDKAYYEGKESSYISKETPGVLVDLGYRSGNGGGESAVGWVSSSELLVVERDGIENGLEEVTTSLYTASILTPQVKNTTFDLENGTIFSLTDDGTVYVLVSDSGETGQEYSFEIYTIDVGDGESELVFNRDYTPGNKLRGVVRLDVRDGVIYLDGYDSEGRYSVYKLDPNTKSLDELGEGELAF